MTTKKFNKHRLDTWVKTLDKDEARIFLIVGMKDNGDYTFIADESMTLEDIAQIFERLVKLIRREQLKYLLN